MPVSILYILYFSPLWISRYIYKRENLLPHFCGCEIWFLIWRRNVHL